MSTATQNSIIRQGFIQLWVAILLLTGLVSPAQGNRANMDGVYTVLDLTNRAMDVLLVKSKGIKQVKSPRLADQALTANQVYQLAVSNLQLLRRLQRKFTMVPTPLVVAPPMAVTNADIGLLATMLLAEVRRLAIQINIWGLPDQKRTFHHTSARESFVILAQIRAKLLVLGGLPSPQASTLALEFSRGATAITDLLTTIDPAQRYQITPPSPTVKSLGDLYPMTLQVRRQLNDARHLLKIAPVKRLQFAPLKQPTGMEIYLQSQIILADLNQLKLAAGCRALTPLGQPEKGADLQEAARQLSRLTLLLPQLRLVKDMVH